MAADVTIRWARTPDVPRLLEMMRTLAAYEGDQAAMRATVATLSRDGFGAAPRFRALLAEQGDDAVGYLTCTPGYSIWAGGATLLVDDVFVAAQARGSGIGRALMDAVRQACADEGRVFVRWTVELDNAPAIGFYKRLGARLQPKGMCTWEPR